MTTKEGFIQVYEKATGKKLSKETTPKELEDMLNKHKPLRKMFFELFPKKVETEEDLTTSGMSQLFGRSHGRWNTFRGI